MKTLRNKRLFTFALLGVALAACAKTNSDAAKKTHAAQEGHEHEKAELHEDELNHEGHGHEENEASDLDRPVSELFAATCEHNIKTHECAECRYEVGVVKADASLFEGGLLKKSRAEMRAVALPLELTGEVRFDERRVAHLSTQAEGIIKNVHVTLGDPVKRGQALVEIESVAVGEAQAAYLESRGMLTLAKRNHARLDSLRKEGISSEKELLAAIQGRDAAQIRTVAALGKLTRLGMTASAARALTQANSKGRLVLRAPSGGTVLNMHAVAGELARAETSLVTVGDNSALWVWADLYDRDIALVSREQAKQPLAAVVGVKAYPGEEFNGTVDFVSPSMNESSRTVKLRVAVPNPEGRLLAGMFAQVKVFISGDQQVLAVPSKSVLADEGRAFVFVHHEADYYVRRPVAVGRTFAGLTEITKGITGSEVVVANGAFLMKSDVLRSKMGAGCAD
ncbi:MAG: efflux RND transporter periplasmic adaptor subunit [Deltaproteobacteria bacterium]|nr:efflux RND transporter periplasmic adaptor subunit [Deltaproteobacteria bacterium]